MLIPMSCVLGRILSSFLSKFCVELVDSVLSFQGRLELVRSQSFAVVLQSDKSSLIFATESVKALNCGPKFA